MAKPMIDGGLSTNASSVVQKANVARPKDTKVVRPWMDWVEKNQIAGALSLIIGVVSVHLLHPESRIHTGKFLFLPYPTRTDDTYTQGTDDIYFIIAWVVNFTALRAVSIEWVLQPVAKFLGVGRKNRLRFAEQGWLALYYSTSWGLGMYLWYNSVYWLNNAEIWTAWPAREMSGACKWYYLVQLAFWLQQILVIHIEARRKDHAQMLTHHIITCTLISFAYVYRYTRAANVVLCLMDLVDFIFPIAKILRYLGYEIACNIAFGVFVIAWLISRHIMYPKLCYDIYTDVPGPNTMLFGCYNGATNELIPDMPAQPDYFWHLLGPFQDLDGVICLNSEVKYIFLGFLLLLQSLSLIWFGMIVKVIVGMVMGGKVDDPRSGDEEEDEVEDVEIKKKGRPMDVTDLNVCVGGSESSSGMTSSGMTGTSTMTSPRPRVTTGRRRLMDAENRKELLARIGCEKPI